MTYLRRVFPPTRQCHGGVCPNKRTNERTNERFGSPTMLTANCRSFVLTEEEEGREPQFTRSLPRSVVRSVSSVPTNSLMEHLTRSLDHSVNRAGRWTCVSNTPQNPAQTMCKPPARLRGTRHKALHGVTEGMGRLHIDSPLLHKHSALWQLSSFVHAMVRQLSQQRNNNAACRVCR